MWIQTGVTVRKRLSWVVTSVTLTFDLWPWPFAWTLPWSLVITPENFMMIRWWEHSQKGVTDGQTDGQTDRRTENTIHRVAWSQLKMWNVFIMVTLRLQSGTENWNITGLCVSISHGWGLQSCWWYPYYSVVNVSCVTIDRNSVLNRKFQSTFNSQL